MHSGKRVAGVDLNPQIFCYCGIIMCMKIGILNAIHSEESRVNWGGTPIEAYIRFFSSIASPIPFEFVGYEAAQGQFPVSPTECDAWVITGSPRGVYDANPWIAELMQFVRDSYAAGTKLVGVCFGHQLIAHALGGKAEKSDLGRNFGLRKVKVDQHKAWMDAEIEHYSLYFAHQDQVTQLPPKAEILASTETAPIALYSIEQQVFCTQGHPEFSAEIMHCILELLKGSMDDQEIAKTRHSIESQQPDNPLIGQWIVNFLTTTSQP